MRDVAIYVRGLFDELTQEKRKALIRAAVDRNWEFKIYDESETVGGTWPVKVDLIKSLRNLKYEGLIIFDLESWARNTTELILELDELIRKGVFVYSVSDNLFLNPVSADPKTKTLEAIARFEKALIDKKRRVAIAVSRYHGTKMGRPKGSKDKAKRKTDGYLKREARKRFLKEEANYKYPEPKYKLLR
jgi:DNA invertase Pin-like site-specific DNA recombinase